MTSNSNNNRMAAVLPVLFTFFVMGFCDVVGIATSYVQKDFGLSETVAGIIPSMVFLWFLLLAVPIAMAMNRIGRKNMVQISNVVTIVGMVIPLVSWNFATSLVAFALLGIGNTILQVSLNPLLKNVVSGNMLTSSLTAGQVVKAISSFLGPVIAAFALRSLDNWQYIFPIYAAITLLSSLWLLFTPIVRESETGQVASLGKTLGLLKNGRVLLLFFGIFFVVCVDVGMNTVTPKLLMERVGLSVDKAGFGTSVYFICRTAGAFIGAFLLSRISDLKYFRINILLAAAVLASLFFASGNVSILVPVGLVGFLCSCVFPIIFGAAIKAFPEKANEMSGLMIMGVCGGAAVTPAMGIMADAMGSQTGSLAVIGVCMAYLIFCAFRLKTSAS